MNRRHFSLLTGASLATLSGTPAFADHHGKHKGEAFKALFGPHPGLLFGGKDKKLSYVDQLKLAHDLGFRAWEDNGLKGQKNETIEKIAEFMKDKKMELGVCVITNGAGAMFNKPTEEITCPLGIDPASIAGMSKFAPSGTMFRALISRPSVWS